MTVASYADDVHIYDFLEASVNHESTKEVASDGNALSMMIPGIFCNDSTIAVDSESITGYSIAGDPTEACIFHVVSSLLERMTVNKKAAAFFPGSNDNISVPSLLTSLLTKYKRLGEIPFDSSTKFMATLHEIDTEDFVKWFGPLPSELLGHSTLRVIFAKGAPEKLLTFAKNSEFSWQEKANNLASRGMRVLALAYRVLPPTVSTVIRSALAKEDISSESKDFRLLSLIGIIDPPRPEAIIAVNDAQRAKIAVKMITGDHPGTAAAIAKQLGIHNNPPLANENMPRLERARTFSRARSRSRTYTSDELVHAVTGNELDKALAMSETAFDEMVISNHVFARTTPEHKLKIVQSLQRQGIICSMTGDGVNDAPALKAANIGVAMGITGTGVAKEASKMVITDDNFATIVEAVRIGRCTYHNLIKILAFVLPTNGGQAFSIIMALVIGMEVPITALQILWVNMVTSITLGLVLAFEQPHPEIMHVPPRRSSKPVFGQFLAWRLFLVTVVLVLAVLGNVEWEHLDHPEYSIHKLRTIAVNTLSVCQVAYLFSCRNLRSMSSLHRIFIEDSLYVWIGVFSVAVFQVIFTYAPPFQYVFVTEDMDGWSWAKCLLLGLCTFVFMEMEKWISHQTAHTRLRFWRSWRESSTSDFFLRFPGSSMILVSSKEESIASVPSHWAQKSSDIHHRGEIELIMSPALHDIESKGEDTLREGERVKQGDGNDNDKDNCGGGRGRAGDKENATVTIDYPMGLDDRLLNETKNENKNENEDDRDDGDDLHGDFIIDNQNDALNESDLYYIPFNEL